MRETERIKQWLAAHPFAKDDVRNEKLIRLWSLEDTTPLSRRAAFQDLNDSAFFHALPCSCDKCDPRKVCQ